MMIEFKFFDPKHKQTLEEAVIRMHMKSRARPMKLTSWIAASSLSVSSPTTFVFRNKNALVGQVAAW